MKLKFFISFLVLVSMSLSAPAQKGRQTYIEENPHEVKSLVSPKGKKAKNVILMIGDGMGPAQVYAGWVANRGKLNIDNCPVAGYSRTYCVDRLVTDSGAGGTALAIGKKTKYLSIGVDAEGNECKTLLDYAAEKGKSTGIATTCILYDATPGDFCCHNTSRYETYDIVADYVESGVDYAIGGGGNKFINRPDGRDILKEMADLGYHTPAILEEVEQIASGRVMAVIYEDNPPLPAERGDYHQRATMKGIELLSQNKKGFAMMVEGSEIDGGGHDNDLARTVAEMLDFDRTVGAVLEWAAKDGETLVVITADHETGGLTLVGGDIAKGEIKGDFSTGSHTAIPVPVYAFGPGAENFTGVFENEDILGKILEVLK